MTFWQIITIIGILFLILEMFTPAMFFLNFALAALITAIFSIFFQNWNILIPIFVVSSAICLLWLRPFLVKGKIEKSQETGIEGKYIGKIAKVIEPVNDFSGAVTIYGERWEARSEDKNEIPVNTEVKIVKNESLILFVKKES